VVVRTGRKYAKITADALSAHRSFTDDALREAQRLHEQYAGPRTVYEPGRDRIDVYRVPLENSLPYAEAFLNLANHNTHPNESRRVAS
jgi:hypothetical protein